LLHLLAKRQNRGSISGTILTEKSSANAAFVHMSDVHFASLTVLQTIYYAAKLRLSWKSASADLMVLSLDCAARVGLKSKVNEVVGSDLHPSELKLLSIAIALISPTNVLMLDEPIRGIESFRAVGIARTLRKISSDTGKTIISTIAEPSYDVLEHFHNLIMLGAGEVVFEGNNIDFYSKCCVSVVRGILVFLFIGRTADFEAFFRKVFPTNVAELESSQMYPVEFALLLLRQESSSNGHAGTIRNRMSTFNRNNIKRTIIPVDPNESVEMSETSALNWLRPRELCHDVIGSIWQTYVLYRRHRSVFMKSIFGMRLILVRNIIGSILIGIIYYNSGKEFDKDDTIISRSYGYFNDYSYNLFALMFMLVITLIFFTGTSIQSMHEAQKVHFRDQVTKQTKQVQSLHLIRADILIHYEQASNVYSPVCFWLSSILVETPVLVATTAVCAVIVNAMIRLRGDLSWFIAGTVLVSCLGYVQAKVCVASTDEPLFASVLFTLITAIEMMLTGVLIPRDDMRLWDWAIDLTFSKWATALMANNEFEGYNNLAGNALLEYFDYRDVNKTECVAVLVAYYCAMELLYLVLLIPMQFSSLKRSEEAGLLALDNDDESKRFKKNSSRSIKGVDDMESSSRPSAVQLGERKSESSLSSPPSRQSGFKVPLMQDGDSSVSRMSDASSFLRESVGGPLVYLSSRAAEISRTMVHVPYDGSSIAPSEHSQRPTDAMLADFERHKLKPDLRAMLVFRGMSYSVPDHSMARGFTRIKDRIQTFIRPAAAPRTFLLRNVSGVVNPGDLCAVLGAPKSGKSTLLRAIHESCSLMNSRSAQQSLGKWVYMGRRSGLLAVGGNVVPTAPQIESALVSGAPVKDLPQHARPTLVEFDDSVNPCLTVEEHLLYSAGLRAKQSRWYAPATAATDLRRRILETAQLLGLEEVLDTVVGSSAHRNITAGQLRRLSIGIELVYNSSVILVEEPTKGLDAHSAFTVITALSNLASSGRTVVCSMSRPLSSTFYMFNSVVLVSEGCSLFSGHSTDFVPYMRQTFNINHSIKNPVDFAEALSSGIFNVTIPQDHWDNPKHRLNLDPSHLSPSIEKAFVMSKMLDQRVFSLYETVIESLNAKAAAFNKYQPLMQLPLWWVLKSFQKRTSPAESWRACFNEMAILLEREMVEMSRRSFWIAVCVRSVVAGIILGTYH
jgi:ABC-type multidrug transport system ATPase subunit